MAVLTEPGLFLDLSSRFSPSRNDFNSLLVRVQGLEDAMTKTAHRVISYSRVSTADQDPAMQVEEMRELARVRGWKLVEECIDHGVSGSTKRREGLDRVLEAVAAGRVDVVVIWKLDRLGRSLQHLLAVIDIIVEHGVQLVSVRDSIIDTTSSAGTLMLQLIGAFAEYERCILIERTRAGMDRARRQGKSIGRPRVHLDLRAAVILLAQGHSIRETASMLGVSKTTLARRLREVDHKGVHSTTPENLAVRVP